MNLKIVLLSTIFTISVTFLGSGWKTPIPLSLETPSGTTNRQNSILCDPYQNLHVFWFTTEPDNNIGSAIYYTNDISGDLAAPNEILVTQSSLDAIHWISTAVSSKDLLLLYNHGPKNILSFSRSPIQNAYDARSWRTDTIFSPVGIHDIEVSGFDVLCNFL